MVRTSLLSLQHLKVMKANQVDSRAAQPLLVFLVIQWLYLLRRTTCKGKAYR